MTNLEKQINDINEAIKGYLKDAKTFGFEPVELAKMEEKKLELLKKNKQ